MTVTLDLVRFNCADGHAPAGDLIADADGDLFGTTEGAARIRRHGVRDCEDAVVTPALPHPSWSASTAPTVLPGRACSPTPTATCSARPRFGGANDDGRCSRCRNCRLATPARPPPLVSFNGANGSRSIAGLIADANGDLFGTTCRRRRTNDGTVFEIVQDCRRLRQHPITLVSFNAPTVPLPGRPDRRRQRRPVRHDQQGGANDDGTVFEIAKTRPATPARHPLVSFTGDGADGGIPTGASSPTPMATCSGRH